MEKEIENLRRLHETDEVIAGVSTKYLAYCVGYLHRYTEDRIKCLKGCLSEHDLKLIGFVNNERLSIRGAERQFFEKRTRTFNGCIIISAADTKTFWPKELIHIVAILRDIGHCAFIGSLYGFRHMKTEIGDILYVNDDTESG